MPRFRILLLDSERSARFREKPPVEPPYRLRGKDYSDGGEIEADSPYEAWKVLQEDVEAAGRKLSVGDVLQAGGPPLLCHYWGFEEAAWEEQAAPGPAPAAEAVSAGDSGRASGGRAG